MFDIILDGLTSIQNLVELRLNLFLRSVGLNLDYNQVYSRSDC